MANLEKYRAHARYCELMAQKANHPKDRQAWQALSHRALLASRSPPNCELAGPEPDTIDADVWARLKLDYERHCYKQAEILARKRLRRLLVSGQCSDNASPSLPAFRHNYATVR